MPSSRTPIRCGLLQRACPCGGTPGPDGECAACRAKRLSRQRQAMGGPAGPAIAPAVVHQVLRGPWQPLDPAALASLEPRFGHDFGRVRVHTDARAAASARAVGAHAYTVGRDVVFGTGQYAPGTAAGRRLLAHELTHVVQQAGGDYAAQGELAVGAPGDAAEREADEIARKVVGVPPQPVAGPTRVRPLLQRACGPALGPPAPDCTPDTSEPAGEVLYFDVNCDTLKPASAAYLSGAFTRTLTALPAGSTLKVHGFASEEGGEEFNEALSCHRANRVERVVRGSAPIAGVFKHGGVPGAADYRRSAVVEIITPARPPATRPTPTAPPPPLCPTVPTSTPASCRGRHDAYCRASTCFPGNPWLRCACGASGDVCDAVDAFSLSLGTVPGAALATCIATTTPGFPLLVGVPPVLRVLEKGRWLLSTNRCIWGHWRAALDAMHDPTRPVPSSLTPEWATAVTTCRTSGVGSAACCAAHVVAEQQAIDRCGPYDSARFGTLATDVPGYPICSVAVETYAAVTGPAFSGDFGNVTDRIAYGIGRCC